MIDQQHEDTTIEYDDTERSQLFHVEVAVSSAWLIAFLLLLWVATMAEVALRGARQAGN